MNEQIFGINDPETTEAILDFADSLAYQYRSVEAEVIFRDVLMRASCLEGTEGRNTLRAMKGLSIVLRAPGQLDKGERLIREVLSIEKFRLGPHDPRVLGDMNLLATILHEQKKPDEATAMFLVVKGELANRTTEEYSLQVRRMAKNCSHGLGVIYSSCDQWHNAVEDFTVHGSIRQIL
jgi:hypothetical protein